MVDELEYAYRCVRDGFERGNFDFTVLLPRARAALAGAEEEANG